MIPAVDLILFSILPYMAFGVAVVATVERYGRRQYSVSSFSSQFLETRQHFWGIVPFHFGIVPVLLGHLAGFLAPGVVLAWNASTTRLYVLESIGLALGLLAVVGLGALVVRRASVLRLLVLTTVLEWFVYALLMVQLASGVYIALMYPWGSSWFAVAAAPYLWSLVRLQPDAAPIAAMPIAVKVHVTAAFLLLAVFPFSRLIHVLAVPNQYLWRRPLVVRWRRNNPRPAGGL